MFNHFLFHFKSRNVCKPQLGKFTMTCQGLKKLDSISEQEMHVDCFKEVFKKLKRRDPPPDYSEVLDFDDLKEGNSSIKLHSPSDTQRFMCDKCDKLGLIPHNMWQIYSLKSIPGLLFISNPFTKFGQRMWIEKCLKNYPEFPNLTNLHSNVNNLPEEKYLNMWEQYLNSNGNEILKLRWATLGYHHNWDTKIYDVKRKTEFPSCLEELATHTAECLKFQNFRPEAAIVNYYNLNSTLNGHTDHSEIDCSAPLFSFSFGRTAIFMIGGVTKSIIPQSMFLKSGDIVVMSGHSRLCYHGVPKILSKGIVKSENDSFIVCDENFQQLQTFLVNSRININVRQVYPN